MLYSAKIITSLVHVKVDDNQKCPVVLSRRYFSSLESYLTVGSIKKTEFVCFSNLTKCTVKSRLCFIKVISPHRIPMSERYIQISTCSLEFRIQCWILITVLHKMRQSLRSFWKMATRKRLDLTISREFSPDGEGKRVFFPTVVTSCPS